MRQLFAMQRQYTTLLPPSVVRRRLEQSIKQPPQGGWKGLLWRISPFYPPCWGDVHPSADSFTARLPMNRTDGPLVQGYWQATPASAGLPAGTSIRLVIKLPLSERLFGNFLIGSLLTFCLWCGVFTHPAQAPLIPIAMLGFFTGLFVLTRCWSLRSAARYFQQALALRPQPN